MSCGGPSIINGMVRLILEDQFFMFSPQRVSVLCRSCYQHGQECENLLSGTQARAENVGRSQLTLTEVFFMFYSSFNSSRNFKQLSKQIIHQHLRLYDVAVCVMPDAISRNHDEL